MWEAWDFRDGVFVQIGVSMLLTTVLLMYIYTACWLNNYVVQLCPFWCNRYGARLSRLLTLTEQHQVTGSNPSGGRKLIVAWKGVLPFQGAYMVTSHSEKPLESSWNCLLLLFCSVLLGMHQEKHISLIWSCVSYIRPVRPCKA
jgi:hypothetical protein